MPKVYIDFASLSEANYAFYFLNEMLFVLYCFKTLCAYVVKIVVELKFPDNEVISVRLA